MKRVPKGGPSPNPKGKPKGTRSLTTILRELMNAGAPDMLQKGEMKELLKRLKIAKPTNGDLLMLRLFIKGMQGDTKAMEMVIDRMDGKPKQEVEINGSSKIIVGFGKDEGDE